jgi:hypothetical protein
VPSFAVRYINEKLGGVDGHPVELHKCSIKNAEEEGIGETMIRSPLVRE